MKHIKIIPIWLYIFNVNTDYFMHFLIIKIFFALKNAGPSNQILCTWPLFFPQEDNLNSQEFEIREVFMEFNPHKC